MKEYLPYLTLFLSFLNVLFLPLLKWVWKAEKRITKIEVLLTKE